MLTNVFQLRFKILKINSKGTFVYNIKGFYLIKKPQQFSPLFFNGITKEACITNELH